MDRAFKIRPKRKCMSWSSNKEENDVALKNDDHDLGTGNSCVNECVLKLGRTELYFIYSR